MIAIKDFKMPKSCTECRFLHEEEECYCIANYTSMWFAPEKKRASTRPLVEVKVVEDGNND